MPRHADVSVEPGQWTELTSANLVGGIRVTNLGSYTVELQRSGTTAPTSREGALPLLPNATLPADRAVDDIWPGATGARIWAYVEANGSRVSVSHA